MVFILHWILYVILGVLFIFIAYFRLIWMFHKFTNDKWRNRIKQSSLEPFRLMLALQHPQYANNAEFQCRGAKSQVFAKFSMFWLFWSPRLTYSIKRPFSFIPSMYNIQRESLKTPSNLGLRGKSCRNPKKTLWRAK